METLARWIYDRHRPRFVAINTAISAVIVASGVSLPGVAAASLYLGLSVRQFLVFLALAIGGVVVTSAGGMLLARPSIKPATDWLRGDRSDPAAAQLAASAAVSRVGRSVLLLWQPFMVVIVAVVSSMTRLSNLGVATFAVACEGTVLAGWVLIVSWDSLMVRPVLEDTSAALPPGLPLVRTVGVGRSVLRAVAGLLFSAGMLTASIATRFHSVEGRFLAALMTAVAASVFLLVLFRAGHVTPILRPLRDLTAATHRVARGEFDQRVPVTTADEFGDLATSFNAMQDGLRERESLLAEIAALNRLRRFLSPHVAEAVLSAGEKSVLEPHRSQVAVLFCDLRGFTAFATAVEPEDVIDVLRDYYDTVVAVLDRAEATVGSFAGDGIMAYFNDPVPCPDPSGTAVTVALALQAPMGGLLQRWERKGFKLGYGIGIAYGYATLGTIGSEGRTDYTALGPVVNLAARLCGEAQSGETLIDQRVYEALGHDAPTQRREVKLKGYAEPVAAYQVVGQDASRATGTADSAILG
jgi:class 3 adenylate cyclase